MAAKSELSIRAAVMGGYSRCTESKVPLCCLGEYLEQLKDLGWSSEDVRAVESRLLRLLIQDKEAALERSQSHAA
jgi:hypothetical protein